MMLSRFKGGRRGARALYTLLITSTRLTNPVVSVIATLCRGEDMGVRAGVSWKVRGSRFSRNIAAAIAFDSILVKHKK